MMPCLRLPWAATKARMADLFVARGLGSGAAFREKPADCSFSGRTREHSECLDAEQALLSERDHTSSPTLEQQVLESNVML